MNSLMTTGFLVAALPMALPASAADPPANPRGITVSIEIRAADDQREGPSPLEVVLTLTDRGGCAEASEDRRDAKYGFKVCSRGEPADAGALSFHLERSRNLPTGSEKREFKVEARFSPGKPIMIARFHEGARQMEVKATIRET